jgi:hypothetical protein
MRRNAGPLFLPEMTPRFAVMDHLLAGYLLFDRTVLQTALPQLG